MENREEKKPATKQQIMNTEHVKPKNEQVWCLIFFSMSKDHRRLREDFQQPK